MSAPIFRVGFEGSSPADLAPDVDGVTVLPVRGLGIGFVAGVRIATPMGYVAVERLAAGDAVLTADGRHARLAWVGSSCVAGRGAHAPVRFETGTLDNIRPLRLGQGHRLRVTGLRADLLFDASAVFGLARSFVNGEDVVVEPPAETVTYVHLMCARREVVLAENVPCETLPPGPDGLERIEAMMRLAGAGAGARPAAFAIGDGERGALSSAPDRDA
ncbi:Hint domain-containing protein [Roseicyclus persicicus]|uniref:Hedgehog/Intein (Hint) domain-containing protein n=1 Tax=Roseicyclus persicicus TaxID=2650661 RepID=A0A7X6GY14_9RHOB|nr:Hint domain-containing protein [Roseibacterium persicicum]NKX44418.1 hypothetical protein [Roseibacterium persicicum]